MKYPHKSITPTGMINPEKFGNIREFVAILKQMKYLCLTAFMVLTLALQAQDEGFKKLTDTKPVEEKLIQASKSITTITSDFIQEKHLEYLSVVIESKGRFWFIKPAILRWEYTEPFKYLIVINQGKITIKDEDKKNEFDINSNKAFQELNDIIVNSVNGTLIESEKYDFEMLEGKESWLVRMFPKNEQVKKTLKNIDLYFLKSDLSVHKIKMIENDQDYTIITLTNKKFNEPVSNTVFEVK